MATDPVYAITDGAGLVAMVLAALVLPATMVRMAVTPARRARSHAHTDPHTDAGHAREPYRRDPSPEHTGRPFRDASAVSPPEHLQRRPRGIRWLTGFGAVHALLAFPVLAYVWSHATFVTPPRAVDVASVACGLLAWALFAASLAGVGHDARRRALTRASAGCVMACGAVVLGCTGRIADECAPWMAYALGAHALAAVVWAAHLGLSAREIPGETTVT